MGDNYGRIAGKGVSIWQYSELLATQSVLNAGSAQQYELLSHWNGVFISMHVKPRLVMKQIN